MTLPHESYFDNVISSEQIFNRSFDRADDSIRVAIASGSVSLTVGSITLGNVKIEDGSSSNKLKVYTDGSLDANIALGGPTDNIALTDSTGSIINPATLESIQNISTILLSTGITQGASGSTPWKIDYPIAQGSNPSAVNVVTSPTLLIAASIIRKKIILFNLSTTNTCFLGSSDVSIFTGMPIPPLSVYNDSMPYCGQEAIYGVVQSGSCSVRIKEWN
jgi:hypothetical protein